MSHNSQYVAVDVSKAALDIAMPGANRVWRSTNTLAGN
jgi:transposase